MKNSAVVFPLASAVLLSSILIVAPASSDDAEPKAGYMDFLNAKIAEATDGNVQPDRQGITEEFFERFGPSLTANNLRAMDEATLIELYESAYYAADIALDQDIAKLLTSVTSEILRRDISIDIGLDGHVINTPQLATADVLLKTRQFKRAGTWIDSHNLDRRPWQFENGQAMPDEADVPFTLGMEADGEHILAKLIPRRLSDQSRVVAVVHPNCAPSRQAMRFYESARASSSEDGGDIIWLVAQSGSVPAEPIINWNRNHDHATFEVSYRDGDWPTEMGTLRTPVFFRLEDGVVADKVVGWPNDEQSEAVSQLLNPEN